MVKEYKLIKAKDFEQVCQDYNFYDIQSIKTEYRKAIDRIFLFGAESVGNLTPDDIVEMAQDIKKHSDTDFTVLTICQILYDEAVDIILTETPYKEDYKYDEDGEEYWEDTDGKRHYTRNEG